MAEALARPDDLRRESLTVTECLHGFECFGLLGRRRLGDDHDRRPRGRPAAQPLRRPRKIFRPVSGDHHDRGDACRRLVESRRDAGTRPIPDPVAVGEVGRRGRCQGEIDAAVGDLPARGLDQVAQPVGLDPVASRAGSGAFMGGGQDLVRDSLSGHPRRIAGGPSPAEGSSDAPL